MSNVLAEYYASQERQRVVTDVQLVPGVRGGRKIGDGERTKGARVKNMTELTTGKHSYLCLAQANLVLEERWQDYPS